MRVSEWRATAPHRDAVTAKVGAVVDPVIAAFGADIDPHCWVLWGDDPRLRYILLVPTGAGLVIVHARVNVPGEGPRAVAKLVRWAKLQVGELAIEMQGGRRIVSMVVEQQVLQGTDAAADKILRFALVLIAGVDGRPWPPFDLPGGRSRRAAKPKAGKPSGVKTTTAKPTAARPARPTSAGTAARPRAGASTGLIVRQPGTGRTGAGAEGSRG
jgi:hypothetical protein